MLFDPVKIKGLKLKNRLVALPVFTGYALPDGRVSPLMLEHYRRLSSSGAAVVVVPNVAVSENGRTSERSLVLDHDGRIDQLKRLAAVIKANNALACIQLNHGGRYAVTEEPMLPSAIDSTEILSSISTLKNFMEGFPFGKRFGLTAHMAKMTAGWTREMTEDDIRHSIAGFGQAARRAVAAGFDMIELHGATGYLIAQFLSPRTNRRPGPWGGSPDARMSYAVSILKEIKAHIPERIPVGFRLILDEMAPKGICIDEAVVFAKKLEEHGAAYLSATVATYQSMFLPDVAKQLKRPGCLSGATRHLKENVNIPVIISNRIVSPKLAEKILQNKEADLIGLGRPLLADPDWIRKAVIGGKITGCKNCNTCFRHVALGQSVICTRWPKAVRDRIQMETRFTSRHGYRTLILLSSVSDFQVNRTLIQRRVPVHRDILDRQLFMNINGEKNFEAEAEKYIKWCNHYLKTQLKRTRVENLVVKDFQDPIETVTEQLKENFGFVSITHDEKSEWKKALIMNAPADVVVVRNSVHSSQKKVMIPCDLSDVTLMQIRVARHVFHGRTDVRISYVHVTRSPGEAEDRWAEIIKNFEIDPSPSLEIFQPDEDSTVGETLLQKAKKEGCGSIIIARRGGLAPRFRRRIFGSVSGLLLTELPECSFFIIG
ncbi:MAG: NADH:flavin oxidoreductase [Desulfobacterales bacterium]|nr:NADH:flavin oxidoreductase [Desulfobacterales bacterium]